MSRKQGGNAHHLSRGHTHGLDRELAPTHVEQILQTGPEQINDENVVQSFLSKMVYLRDTGYRRLSVSCTRERERVNETGQTDDILREYDRNDTRHGAAALLPFVVPGRGSGASGHVMLRSWRERSGRTNLMATVWELSRLVPREEETGSPSATTQHMLKKRR